MLLCDDLPLDVSRETYERLRAFEALVKKWSPRINLISKDDAPHIWARHISDSAQIATHTDFPATWLDIGAGGGFPAVVLACIAAECAPNTKFHLIESDKRKCAFLHTARAALGLSYTVISKRAEDIRQQNANTISARALAPLSDLFALAEPHAAPGATLIFPKGQTHKQEISAARANWAFKCTTIPSITNPEAAILIIQDLQRANQPT